MIAAWLITIAAFAAWLTAITLLIVSDMGFRRIIWADWLLSSSVAVSEGVWIYGLILLTLLM